MKPFLLGAFLFFLLIFLMSLSISEEAERQPKPDYEIKGTVVDICWWGSFNDPFGVYERRPADKLTCKTYRKTWYRTKKGKMVIWKEVQTENERK